MVIATYTNSEIRTMENWLIDMGRVSLEQELPTEEEYNNSHFPIEGIEEVL